MSEIGIPFVRGLIPLISKIKVFLQNHSGTISFDEISDQTSNNPARNTSELVRQRGTSSNHLAMARKATVERRQPWHQTGDGDVRVGVGGGVALCHCADTGKRKEYT